jgi:hypothetical protein
VFENGSVRAYRGNVESIFHVFPIYDLIAISRDYDKALRLSVAHDRCGKRSNAVLLECLQLLGITGL